MDVSALAAIIHHASSTPIELHVGYVKRSGCNCPLSVEVISIESAADAV